jgi:hypothetical protein
MLVEFATSCGWGGPGCPLWGYRGGIATRSYQLSRQKSELRRAQSMRRMTSTSSGYATQVAGRQATWATLRSEEFYRKDAEAQGRKEMPQDQGITLPTFASLRLGVFALNSCSSIPIFRPPCWVPNLEENRSKIFNAIFLFFSPQVTPFVPSTLSATFLLPAH